VQDVSSRGLVHRIKGWKAERAHHLFSNLERDYFYLLEWSLAVTDIREQFPLLPLAETMEIAEQCGIRHPADPKTRHPVVMTTDFLVTVAYPGQPAEQARALKPVSQLSQTRVLEKLELERRYWHNRNIDWGIVTPREIPRTVSNNMHLLRSYFRLEDRLSLQEDVSVIASVLTERVKTNPDTPLRQIASDCDRQLGFGPGTSLAVAYHLLATRQWRVDMHTTTDPGAPLVWLDADSEEEVATC
jgi:hypothetical protein